MPEVVEETPAEVPVQPVMTDTAELHTEILKYVAEPQQVKIEELLRTEEDGQMSLAIGDDNGLEKQITGQMSIGEILEAWEEKKRQAKVKMEAAETKKPAVLFETGEISGLLEDFIPKTPKDIEPVAEETIETAPEAELEEVE